jgi:tetratricopeptide (TPR) repeat protein
VRERPLVGREREQSLLGDALDEARAGHFGAAFVAGPAGIGKTALVAAFARRAHAAGAPVLLGRADEGPSTPFGILREAISHWARHTTDPPEVLADLTPVVPGLTAPDPHLPHGPRAPHDEPGGTHGPPTNGREPAALFTGIGRWIEVAASGPAPLVLVLDDLQWADQGSLLALRHLLRHPPEAGALMLGTYRDTDITTGHPLFDLLAAARADAHVRRVGLGGLSDTEVVELLRTAAPDHSVDPGFADELARLTGGNPMLVHETVRALTEQGTTHPKARRWLGQASLPAFGVTAATREIVRAGQQSLADTAFEDAIAHFETALDLLERRRNGDQSEAEADLAFDAAFGLGQAGGALGDRVRQRRGFMEAAAVARRQGRADRLAHAAVGFVDYVNAGSATPLTIDARDDDQALAQQLIDEALAGVADAPTAGHCLLLTHQATRALTLERTDEARSFAAAAVGVAERLGDPTAVPFAQVALLWSNLGFPCDRSLREAPARALGFTAPPAHRVSLRAFVVPMLPIVPLHLGDRTGVDAVRRRNDGDPDTRGSVHLAGYAQMLEATVALAEGRLDDAQRMAAALPGGNAGNVWGVISALQSVSAALERGDQAVAALLAALLLLVPDSTVARALYAGTLAVGGQHEQAVMEATAVRAQQPLDVAGWATPLVLRHLGEVAARAGDPETAADVLAATMPYAGQMLVTFMGTTLEGAADRTIGLALLTLGRHDEALDRLRSARALEAGFGADALVARTTYWLARAHLARDAPGDVADARSLLAEATATTARLGMRSLHDEVGSFCLR